MLDLFTFNPRDLRCKNPYGAVPSGTRVTFTLHPPRGAGFSRGTLAVKLEFRENAVVKVPLVWTGREGSRDRFTATLDLGDYVGLGWYTATLEGLDGRQDATEELQLTVYDGAAAPVSPWFGAGMSYQIFPDRFRRTAVPDPQGLVGDRTVHANWENAPSYSPDGRGEVRNRDFFGGSLLGVEEKLGYLRDLGVETLYFCPIFEAAENHRYGTGDYEKVDPMLGTNQDFSRLCQKAHKLGMHVMLDGVFNHVGYVSRYFNGDGSYGAVGAARDPNSPYRPWFHFHHWPDRYEGWWNFYTLPAVQEQDPSYRAYMLGEEGIVRRWLRAGADGWRLDVADELPDDFVAQLNAAAKEEKPEAVVIGEVWEDGSTKIAYGLRRRHVLGGHCDGLMNYPLRTALVDYLLGGDAADFRETMEALREHYPRDIFYSCMNSLGTHDTPRILTLLAVGSPCREQSKAWRADFCLTEGQRALGLKRLRVGLLALFAFPGSPTVYYGDEAGMEGFEDPFNRRGFPWGHENSALTDYVAALGQLRKCHSALRDGDIAYLAASGPLLAFRRRDGAETIQALCNAGAEPLAYPLPWGKAQDLVTGEVFSGAVPLDGVSARLLRKG